MKKIVLAVIINLIVLIILLIYNLSQYKEYKGEILSIDENYITIGVFTNIKVNTPEAYNSLVNSGYFDISNGYKIYFKDVLIVDSNNNKINMTSLKVGDQILVINKDRKSDLEPDMAPITLKNIKLIKKLE